MIQLSKDLNKRFGKGFSDRNLRYICGDFFSFISLVKSVPNFRGPIIGFCFS
ncbi:hypothetical protein LEP1GSC193_0927 [Leptospira alstonii serovar Pingchang str. 80-412]|uniref:Uncharacterized protein n=1 Tax=Leptospira alstonii serovar Pingchang str. 80-412 TaxID=1218564 RepID=T0FR32_9LEPT|nr:hypothetical protein LEP1GSC193_0927 [Leptospira alstonii serovar Pingchang str. 80-412]